MRINNPFETYSRGMTARERRIRSRWALMFVISSLIAVWSTVKYYNEVDDLEKQRVISTMLQTKNVKMQDIIAAKDSLLSKRGITALINERDSLINKTDSLSSELYVCNLQLQRWEWAYENFKEREPKPAQRFGLIYKHETE